MNKPLHIQAHSFTRAYTGLTNTLISEVRICPAVDPSNPPVESSLNKYLAIWDTGATNSVITQKVINECNLKPIGVTRVNTVGGMKLSNVYLVGILLPNGVGIPQVRVTQGTISDNIDALIGMDIICKGDFAVTNKDGKTHFTFRIPSLECLDFVKQEPNVIQSGNQTLTKLRRNDPCFCGSGKKYKRCHGANK